MRRMLILTRHFPYAPMNGGDSAYSRGVVEAFGESLEVTALAADQAALGLGPDVVRGGVRWRLVPRSSRLAALSFLTAMPNIMWMHATRAYRTALRRLLGEPWDVVAIDHLGAAHVLQEVIRWRRRTPTGRIVYISHEHETSARGEKYRAYGGGALKRAAMRLDLAKIHAWEKLLLRSADVVTVINPEETALYRSDAPNGVFVGFQPGFAGRKWPPRNINASTPRRVAVVSGWRTEHKRLILKRWLETASGPLAAANIEHFVFGDMDPVLMAAHRSTYPHVTFMGFVDDLGEHLQSCRLAVVPDFIGRGVKIRLLDYVFSRTPIVSVRGAVDGLPLAARADYREANDLEGLSSLCESLIDDFDALNAMHISAIQACDSEFSWQSRVRNILARIASSDISHSPASNNLLFWRSLLTFLAKPNLFSEAVALRGDS